MDIDQTRIFNLKIVQKVNKKKQTFKNKSRMYTIL